MHTLTIEEKEQAANYAGKVISTIAYTQARNQSNIGLICHQHKIGKQAEFGVRQWFLDRGIPCTRVDCTVTQNKSFGPDLMIDLSTKVHVKSQEIKNANIYGTSWTFAYGSSLGTRGHRDTGIFDNYGNKDLAVFCLVDPDNWVSVKACIPVRVLHEFQLFKEPVRKDFAGIKKVVWLKDLPGEYWVDKPKIVKEDVCPF